MRWLRSRSYGPIGVDLGTGAVKLVQLVAVGERYEIAAAAHEETPLEARGEPSCPRPETPLRPLRGGESGSSEVGPAGRETIGEGRDAAGASDSPSRLSAHDVQRVETLRRMLGAHPFRGCKAVACLGSGDLFIENVRLPKVGAEELDRVVRWEAEERLAYPIAEAEIRYLNAGDIREKEDKKREVILLACRRRLIERLTAILEAAGLRPVGIDAEPCALVRSYLSQWRREEDRARRCLFLDVGAHATTAVIARGPQILFAKYLPFGGFEFDQAVAQYLDIPVADAARLRRQTLDALDTLDGGSGARGAAGSTSPLTPAASSLPFGGAPPEREGVAVRGHSAPVEGEAGSPSSVARQLVDALRGSLESFLREVSLCLRYYSVTFRGQPLDQVVLYGGEASRWLTRHLNEHVDVPCTLGDPLQVLSGSALEGKAQGVGGGRSGRWAVAVGLAFRGFGKASSQVEKAVHEVAAEV